MTNVSIIIPVFRERENIMPLLERLGSALDENYEVVFVDDGSDDGTEAVLCEAVKKSKAVRVLFMGRRLGKGRALLAGYAAASGEVLVTLDADLQNPPEEIPKLLSALEGAHLVVGWRKERSDSSSRRIQSALYNAALRFFAGSPFHDINCGFRAFRREVLNDDRLFTDRHRLFPLLVHSAGYSTREVVVSHSPRRFGRSKFGLGRIFSAFADVVLATVLRWQRHSRCRWHSGSTQRRVGHRRRSPRRKTRIVRERRQWQRHSSTTVWNDGHKERRPR